MVTAFQLCEVPSVRTTILTNSNILFVFDWSKVLLPLGLVLVLVLVLVLMQLLSFFFSTQHCVAPCCHLVLVLVLLLLLLVLLWWWWWSSS